MNTTDPRLNSTGSPPSPAAQCSAFRGIDRRLVMNGTVWQAVWPLCWTVVIQWIDHDQWLVLDGPDKCPHGGTALMAVGHGPIIKTHSEVCALLEKWLAVQQPQRLLLENVETPNDQADS